MVWEHNFTRHLLTQGKIWNLKIKNSVKYHLTKHIVSSKIITLEGISWRRQISFFPSWSTHKDQKTIGVNRRLLKEPFRDTHLVQSNNIFKKKKKKVNRGSRMSSLTWWADMCGSQQQQSEKPDALHVDPTAVNSDFFLQLNADCWVLKVSRLGRTATTCLFWNFLWMEMQRK